MPLLLQLKMLNKNLNLLFFIYFFLIQFNSIGGIDFLKEYKSFASYYILIPLIIITMVIKPMSVRILNIILIVNFIFFLNFITNFFNEQFISFVFFKQLLAVNLLLFSVNTIHSLYKNNIDEFLKLLFKASKISFAVLLIYILFIQAPFIYGEILPLGKIVKLITELNISTHFENRRVYGFSAEPSFLSVYLILITPLFIYFLKSRNNGISLFLLFMFFSFLFLVIQSRLGYVLFLGQIIIYFYFYSRCNIKFIKTFITLIISLLIFVVLSINFLFNFENNLHYFSNIQRINSLLTGMQVFYDNPVFGIGWGQFKYYYEAYVVYFHDSFNLKQALVNHETSDIIIHNFYIRLLADLGLVGFVSFVLLFIYFPLKKIVNIKNNIDLKFLLTSYFVSNIILFNSVQSLKFELTIIFLSLIFIYSKSLHDLDKKTNIV